RWWRRGGGREDPTRSGGLVQSTDFAAELPRQACRRQARSEPKASDDEQGGRAKGSPLKDQPASNFRIAGPGAWRSRNRAVSPIRSAARIASTSRTQTSSRSLTTA